MSDRKRSGITVDRAYRIKQKLKVRLDDIFSSARSFKLTHDKITEQVLKDVFQSHEGKMLPGWARGYLDGYWDALRNDLYRNHLTWVMFCDGQLMTKKEIDDLTRKEALGPLGPLMDPKYKSPWSRIKSDKSVHVWNDKEGNPLKDKPYNANVIKSVPVLAGEATIIAEEA